MKVKIAESLAGVHTHTHTHTHTSIFTKGWKLSTKQRESLNLKNIGFNNNAKNIKEKLYIRYEKIKVNIFYKCRGTVF